MGLIFRSRLEEENEWLEQAWKEATNHRIEEMRKRLTLESILMQYQSLGSVDYLRKLVEADKMQREKAGD